MFNVHRKKVFKAVTFILVIFVVCYVWDAEAGTTYTVNAVNSGDYTIGAGISCDADSCDLSSIDQTDDNDGGLNEAGTHSATQWDSGNSWVELTDGAASGNYTSRIIDAGGDVDWTSLAWIPTRPSYKPLITGTETGYSDGNIDPSGLQILYHMDESSGTITDASGNGNNSSTASATYGQVGRFNTALSFPDATNVITINSPSAGLNITTGSVTVSAWVNPSAAGHASWNYFAHHQATTGYKWEFGVYGSGDLDPSFKVCSPTLGCDDAPSASAGPDMSVGSWYHVVGVFDNPNNLIQLYINGILEDQTANNEDMRSGQRKLRIGGNGGNGNFNGLIDEFSIWNRALNSDEVSALYKRGASRFKLQVRSCDDPLCDTEGFVGPGGSDTAYYTELANSTVTTPSVDINADVAGNRYFQYKVYFEADRELVFNPTIYTPELESVTIGPAHYNASNPTIVNNTGFDYSSFDVNGFTTSESGTIKYQISPNGTTWYWWSGGGWATTASGYTEANTDDEIRAHINTFAGGSDFRFRAYLNAGADGTTAATLSSVQADYSTLPPGVTISEAAVGATEGGAAGEYTVVLDSAPTDSVTIDLTAAGGEVTVNPDPLTFTTGNWSTPQTVTVTAINDTVYEGANSVTISHAITASGDLVNYPLAMAIDSVTANVTDNDTQPSVTLSINNGTISEASGSSTVTATLSNASNFATTVNLGNSGTASKTTDVSGWSNSIVIAAGQLSGSITLTAINNDVDEANKTLTVSIDSVTNGTENGNQLVTITITDDDETVIAHAGADRTITSGGSIQLNGSSSVAAESYAWSVTSGGGEIAEAETATPTYTASQDDAGDVEVTLTVTSESELSDTDTVVIHVISADNVSRGDYENCLAATAGSYSFTEDCSSEEIFLTMGNATIFIPADDYTLAVSKENVVAIGLPNADGKGAVYFSLESINELSGNIDLSTVPRLASPLSLDQLGMSIIEDGDKNVTADVSESFFSVNGSQDGDQFGAFLCASDVTSDQIDEFIVGAPGAGRYGVAYVFDSEFVFVASIFGSAANPVSSCVSADYLATEKNDILLGPNNPALNMNLRRQGAIFGATADGPVIAGPITYEDEIDLSTAAPDAEIGIGGSSYYESAAMGDVNDDGEPDLVMVTQAQDVYVFYGAVSALVELNIVDADIFISGAVSGCGRMAAVGDVSGDGVGDIVIGCPDYNGTGGVYVVFGGISLPRTIDLSSSGGSLFIAGPDPDAAIGSDLVVADLNSDGTDEIYTIRGANMTYRIDLTGSLSGLVSAGQGDDARDDTDDANDEASDDEVARGFAAGGGCGFMSCQVSGSGARVNLSPAILILLIVWWGLQKKIITNRRRTCDCTI